MRLISFLSLLFFLFAVSGCSQFFEKDNSPQPSSLVTFRPEIKPQLKWTTNTWISLDDNQLKQTPAISGEDIFTGSASGYVTAVNKLNGRIKWHANTRLNISSGPGANEDIVVFGTRYGQLLALNKEDGNIRWRSNVGGEVIANPSLSEQVVVAKTTDGNVFGLNALTGQKYWQFQQTEPSLILHDSSSPLISHQSVIVGFANGNLARLNLYKGELLWLQPIATPEGAFAIQRMIDIDANPIIYNRHIYAATFQGKIASLDWMSGKIRWSHYISSYTGMVAEDDSIYISDAKSFVWAFDSKTGEPKWKQTKLQARGITAPALIGNYLVIADHYGYLHWLDKTDGHFVAREKLKAGVLATPLAEGNTVYILTAKGHLSAYTVPL